MMSKTRTLSPALPSKHSSSSTASSTTCTMEESITSLSLDLESSSSGDASIDLDSSVVSFDKHVVIHNIPNQRKELNKKDKSRVWWSPKELNDIKDNCYNEVDTLKQQYGEENAISGLISHTDVFAFRGLEMVGRTSSKKTKKMKRSKREYIQCLKLPEAIDIEDTCNNYRSIVDECATRALSNAHIDEIAIRDYMNEDTTTKSSSVLDESNDEDCDASMRKRRGSLMVSAKNAVKRFSFAALSSPTPRTTTSVSPTGRRLSRRISSFRSPIVNVSQPKRSPIPAISPKRISGLNADPTKEKYIQSMIDVFAESGLIDNKQGAKALKQHILEEQQDNNNSFSGAGNSTVAVR